MQPSTPTDSGSALAQRPPKADAEGVSQGEGVAAEPPGPVAGTIILAFGLVVTFVMLAIKIANS